MSAPNEEGPKIRLGRFASGPVLLENGEEFIVTTDPVSFQEVQDGLKTNGVEFAQAELSFLAKNEVSVGGKDAKKLVKIEGGTHSGSSRTGGAAYRDAVLEFVRRPGSVSTADSAST